MELFYRNDSDDRLIAKKNALELKNWIDYLLCNGEELEILINIEKKLSNGRGDLARDLKQLATDNKLHLGVFYRYKNSLVNLHECGDMECDTYYMSKHEEFRIMYAVILESTRKLKQEIYTRILVKI